MSATGREAVTTKQLAMLQGASGGAGEVVTVQQAAVALGQTGLGANDSAITLQQLKRAYEAFPPLEIVSWADGTDEQIAAMVAAADAGEINLSDYWSAGDTRTVRLSAIRVTGGFYSPFGENHAAQDVQFVLSDPGHFNLSNGEPCSFVVIQKDCLKETGVMDDETSEQWEHVARRTWCDSAYRNAIPAALRPIFKQFVSWANGGITIGSTASSIGYFALFSEKEVLGETVYASRTAEARCSQLDYYKTKSNRIKRLGPGGSTTNWWTRSPRGSASPGIVYVNRSGSTYYYMRDGEYGLAPFGCI